jgi:acetoin utilization protein AcuB
MSEPIVDQFMTRVPYTIGADEPLSLAHQMMRQHGIRHLPVVQNGKLAGIVSQRDLYFLETLADVYQDQVAVREAMSVDTYAVGPRSTLRKVAGEMATHGYGCAVVMEKGAVIGILTTVDALHALSVLLSEQHRAASDGVT